MSVTGTLAAAVTLWFTGGNVQAAATAYSIGSGAEAAYNNSKQRITNYGPRIGELKVQASQYGGMITRLYGTNRIAGNVIFATNIFEAENRTSQRQGKGGPKVTTVEYIYTVDLAVGLCEGEITGLRRIWANGKVVYDVTETATGEALAASAQLAKSITIYRGTDDQLPDPTLEALYGVGNVPAYRGLAYIVFDELLLTQEFGFRIPQFEFEVVKAGDPEPLIVYGDSFTATDLVAQGMGFGHVPTNGDDVLMFRSGDGPPTPVLPCARIDVFAVSQAGGTLRNTFIVNDIINGERAMMGYSDVPGTVIYKRDLFSVNQDALVYFDENGARREFDVGDFRAHGGTNTSRFVKRGDYILFVGDDGVTTDHPLGLTWGVSARLFKFSDQSLIGGVDINMTTQKITNAILTDSYVWLLWLEAGTDLMHCRLYDITDFSYIRDFDLPTEYDGLGWFHVGANDDDTLCFWNQRGGVPVANYSELVNIDPEGAVTIVQTESSATFAPPSTSYLGARNITVRGGMIFGAEIQVPTASVIARSYVASFFTLAAQGVPLADVITAETALCDIESSDLDVADCTEIVEGYAIARVASARANLEPLQIAYRRDVIESEWKLKFPKRGGLPIVTIPYLDLGAEEAEISMTEPLATTRAQELDLPRQVTVTYINQEQDYLAGSELSRRLITRSSKEDLIDLAVVMPPDQAAQVADAIMYDAWTARTARQISLLRKYSQIESGDVFNVIDRAGNTLRLRAVETEYAGPIIKINVVEDDATVNMQTTAGAVGDRPQTVTPIAPSTIPEFLDIPILQDDDDNAGIYAALRPIRATGWRGAELLRESSGGDLTLVGQVRNSATVGVTETALGNWTGGNVFDETSTVTVTLYAGEFDAATRDDLIDGTANALLIGSEIVQFCNRDLISGTTYVLSGFLRGRRGTEWAQIDHAAGERVVLLGIAGTLRPEMGVSELNTPQLFDVRSIGNGNLSQYTVTNTGVGLKPFAVADLSRDGDAFVWNRRTRLQHRFLAPGIDPPLGEQVESYDAVLSSSGGVVLESATVSFPSWTPSTTLTAGQVVTVYQRSAAVGRGYPSSLTV